jgi:hypothetical protein
MVASLPLTVLLGAAFVLDLLVAASTSRLFLGGTAALGVLAVGAAWAWSRRAECLLPLVPFAALLILLPQIDLSPLKPFARFYTAIKPGMTEAEVLRILDDQFPSAGRYPRPLTNRRGGPSQLGFILDPKDGCYDAEIVNLDFEAGRVVTKRYYPD